MRLTLLTLKTMSVKKRTEWANRVFKQMKERINLNVITRAYFHTGREYREFLIPKLQDLGILCFVPLKGLSFGQQLAWYGKSMSKSS